MKHLIIWAIITFLLFGTFLATLIIGLVKKRRKLLLASGLSFVVFLIAGAYSGFTLATKSYNRVNAMFSPRTGEEIYVALFGKPQIDCVKVRHHQDQVVPKIDYAIWLHFDTCPEELARLLQQQSYTEEKSATMGWNNSGPLANDNWFKPELLGIRCLCMTTGRMNMAMDKPSTPI